MKVDEIQIWNALIKKDLCILRRKGKEVQYIKKPFEMVLRPAVSTLLKVTPYLTTIEFDREVEVSVTKSKSNQIRIYLTRNKL